MKRNAIYVGSTILENNSLQPYKFRKQKIILKIIQYRKQYQKALMIDISVDQDIYLDKDQYRGSTQQLLKLQDTEIKEVWAHNFKDEVINMMKLCQKFNVIAMDTQFPGICVNRSDVQSSQQINEYNHVRKNVQETKLIQIGFTISDEQGNVPLPVCSWQFNFKFNLKNDIIAPQAKQLLKKAGIQFEKLAQQGIEFGEFAEYFVGSDIIYNPNIKWVVFHGSYDFAYLLRLLKNEHLPSSIEEFQRDIQLLFPCLYDLKYIIKNNESLKQVGLNRLGDKLGCSRIGSQHQAGSDSLLTLFCYFKMFQKEETKKLMKDAKLSNIIFGIGKGLVITSQNFLTREVRGDYLENSSNQYFDCMNYMAHHPYNMNGMNMAMGQHPQGPNPLFQYLSHQPNMMFSNEYHHFRY